MGSGSLTRDGTQPPALGVQSLSHWTTGEILSPGTLSCFPSDRGSGVGDIFGAGMHTLSAVSRLTEDTNEDEEQQRQRIEAQEGGQAVGAALGIAVAALLAIRDEEDRKAEAAMQEELYDEQESIWQLSM